MTIQSPPLPGAAGGNDGAGSGLPRQCEDLAGEGDCRMTVWHVAEQPVGSGRIHGCAGEGQSQLRQRRTHLSSARALSERILVGAFVGYTP
jgi:hypothetical protein